MLPHSAAAQCCQPLCCRCTASVLVFLASTQRSHRGTRDVRAAAVSRGTGANAGETISCRCPPLINPGSESRKRLHTVSERILRRLPNIIAADLTRHDAASSMSTVLLQGFRGLEDTEPFMYRAPLAANFLRRELEMTVKEVQQSQKVGISRKGAIQKRVKVG